MATDLVKSFCEDPKKMGIDDFMRELLEFLKRFDRAQHENTARELKVIKAESRSTLSVDLFLFPRCVDSLMTIPDGGKACNLCIDIIVVLCPLLYNVFCGFLRQKNCEKRRNE